MSGDGEGISRTRGGGGGVTIWGGVQVAIRQQSWVAAQMKQPTCDYLQNHERGAAGKQTKEKLTFHHHLRAVGGFLPYLLMMKVIEEGTSVR